MSGSEVDLVTIRSIVEKRETIPILRALYHANEPLRTAEIVEISGVDYDKSLSICYRLVTAGILALRTTAFDRRMKYWEIVRKESVKQIFDYIDNQEKRERDQGITRPIRSGSPEEV